jgi:predicted P-loop ATPase
MRGDTDVTRVSFGEVLADLNDHVDWAGVLAFDTFRGRVVAVDPPMRLEAEAKGLSDNDVNLIRAWFEYHGKKLNKDDVRAAIETVARRNSFDPRVQYLKSVTWDTAPRLDRVLPEYFATKDSPYERAVGPKWFISLVARAMTPGCQSDCTLVLEGLPGKRKTSAFRDGLLPDPSWYAETSCGVDSKDFYENLRGVWIQAFDELDTLSRGAVARVNSMLTATRDRYRQSYGHYSDDFPRTCGFCGSTNAEKYALNEAMSRRLWPVRVLHLLDVDKIKRDRDQLWAEAFARWQQGELWYVNDPQAHALCEEERSERLVVADAWEEQIAEWIQNPAAVTWVAPTVQPSNAFKGGMQPYDGSQGITTAGLLQHCLGKLKGQWTHGDAMRVGHICNRLGMRKRQVWIGKVRVWRFFP